MNIGVLGGGVMGELLVRGLLAREVVEPGDLLVAEVLAPRRAALEELGVRITAEAGDLSGQSEVVLLCVKPQAAREALAPLRKALHSEALVISIMAGLDMAFLCDLLQHERLVRSMPNLPARIGEGITVWCAAPRVTDQQALIAKMVFQALGREVRVQDENLINAATAVSASRAAARPTSSILPKTSNAQPWSWGFPRPRPSSWCGARSRAPWTSGWPPGSRPRSCDARSPPGGAPPTRP